MSNRLQLNKLRQYEQLLKAMEACAKTDFKSGYRANNAELIKAFEGHLYVNRVGSSLYLPFYMYESFVRISQ